MPLEVPWAPCQRRLAIFAFIVVVTAHASPSACPRFGPARLEPQAAVPEQGYQASEVASFLGCHASNVSRAL